MTDKKVALAQCKGKHQFIVTRWMTSGGIKKAIEVRCTCCLAPVSVEAIEVIEWREAEGFDNP